MPPFSFSSLTLPLNSAPRPFPRARAPGESRRRLPPARPPTPERLPPPTATAAPAAPCPAPTHSLPAADLPQEEFDAASRLPRFLLPFGVLCHSRKIYSPPCPAEGWNPKVRGLVPLRLLGVRFQRHGDSTGKPAARRLCVRARPLSHHTGTSQVKTFLRPVSFGSLLYLSAEKALLTNTNRIKIADKCH